MWITTIDCKAAVNLQIHDTMTIVETGSQLPRSLSSTPVETPDVRILSTHYTLTSLLVFNENLTCNTITKSNTRKEDI